MADKSVGELIAAQSVTPTDLFVLEQNGTAKKLTGQILENWLVSFADGHGGIQSIEKLSTSGLVDTYRITLADATTYNFTVTNGRGIKSWVKSGTSGLVDTYTMTLDDGAKISYTVTNGEPGAPGAAGTVWIKYASQKPTQESHSIGDIPDEWIGICPSASPSAPTDWREYTWFLWKGRQGEPGEIGKSGLSIFPVNTDSTDVEATFFATDIQTSGRAPQIGDLLLTPNGRVFKIHGSEGESYSAGFFSSIRGPSGDSAYEQEEQELIMALFKNATYSQPMTDTLNALSRLWGFIITVSFYDSLGLGEFDGTIECPKGMTWGEFVDSEYNTKGFHFTGSTLYSGNEHLVYGVLRNSSEAPTYNRITSDVEVGKYSEYTYDLP